MTRSLGNPDRGRNPERVPAFWWVIGLAVVVRLIWALLIPVVPVSDPAAYDTMARHLAAGHGLSLQPFTPDPDSVTPSAYWAVGGAAVYAAGYALVGHSGAVVVAINLLANVLTIALVMKLVARWFGGAQAAAAGLALAFWPGQFMFVTLLASELLFACGVVAALYAWSRTEWDARFRVPLVGVLLGLSCLVRPTALLLPVVLVLAALPRPGFRWRACGQAAAAGLVMLAVVLPWSLRNQRVLGEFVLVSANSGANLWMGNHPGTDGGYAMLPPHVQGMSEVQRDAELKRLARAYIRAEPLAFARRTAVKALRLHDRETVNVLWNQKGIQQRFGSDAPVTPLKLVSTGYWWLMLGGAAAGGVMLVLGRRDLLASPGWVAALLHPAVLLWAYFASVHAVVVIQDRYHWPSVPFIAALASLPAAALWRRAPGRGGSAAPPQPADRTQDQPLPRRAA